MFMFGQRNRLRTSCAPAAGRSDFYETENQRWRSTADNKEYEVTPSASPKLPLVASSRRQLLIFLTDKQPQIKTFIRESKDQNPILHKGSYFQFSYIFSIFLYPAVKSLRFVTADTFGSDSIKTDP